MRHRDPPWLVCLLLLMVIASLLRATLGSKAEDAEIETVDMTVIASLLNGRSAPRKKSSVEARFDCGDVLEAIRWSRNKHWIEVFGGETGTVWVWWEYLTERTDYFYAWNHSGAKIKIRKEPFGRVTGYLKNGEELLIDQVIFGWGHSNKGWILMEKLTEEE